ncbi:hypothetical protein VNO80_17533 [Phaseolus coccineus]|uniref:HTH myb-type domain-containing protein n=1 Tax=Phaseolus coccineus TaxID=3886 RepID=A0AAN9QVL8_PHACN
MADLVYLDHAGATLYSDLQMESVFNNLTNNVYGNPHCQRDSSSATLDIVKNARQQAQFRNKWAKIATYLAGRTDNDVKNFWSSRRKRLERMLEKPPTLKLQKNKGKTHFVFFIRPSLVWECLYY